MLLDVARQPPVDLEANPNWVTALFRLEQSETPGEIAETIRWLAQGVPSSRHRSLRRALVVWLRRVLLPRRMPGATIPRIADLEAFQAMLAERVAEWPHEWQEERRRQGCRDGEARMLLRLLERRFGAVSPEARASVDRADTDTLSIWAERVWTARQLDDVFDG